MFRRYDISYAINFPSRGALGLGTNPVTIKLKLGISENIK